MTKWLSVFFCFLLSGVVQQSSGTIQGLVADAGGRPLAGVRVGVIDQLTAVMQELQTDASGRFRVENLNPSGLYRIIVAKYGYRAFRRDDVSPGGEGLSIRLEPESSRPRRVTPAPAPVQKPSDELAELDVIKLENRLVVLNVSVKDARGNPVLDLQQSNFTVLEEGVPREIVFFDANAPLSAVLLIDNSSSMQGSPLQEAKRAALEFIDESHPEDEISLIAFSDRVGVVNPFTRDRSELRAAINQLAARGGTALYDAVAEAIGLMQGSHTKRHAIVVLSDGQDEDSTKTFSQVEQMVRSSDAVLFAVGEYAPPERRLFMKRGRYYKEPPLDVNLNPIWVLRQLTDLSGGGAFFPHPHESLAPLFSLIARELGQQYILGFNPPDRSGEPRFRTLDVRVERSGHKSRLQVRTRKGYLRD